METGAEFTSENRREENRDRMAVTRALVAGAESTGEQILPDYKGEIKRVLMDTARAVPSGSYMGGGEASFTGTVVYQMLYLDAEDRLSEAEFTTGYEITVPVPENTSAAFADVYVSGWSIRPSGPRKVNLRAGVTANILLSEEKNLAAVRDGEPGDLEEQRREILSREVVRAESGEREYAGEAQRIEGISPDAVEILGAGGNVRIESRRATPEGILLSGTIDMTAIIRVGGEAPYAVANDLPFEELLPYGKFGAGAQNETAAEDLQPTMAKGILTSAVASAVADPEKADTAVITLNAVAEFFAEAEHNLASSVTVDAYAAEKTSEEEYESFGYSEFLCADATDRSLAFSAARGELSAKDADSVIYTFAAAKVREAKAEGGRATVRGEIDFSTLADRVLPDGRIEYFPIKKSFDFEENVKFNCQIPDNASILSRVVVYQARTTMDEEKVYFDANILLETVAVADRTARRLAAITTSAPTAAEGVRVFYPGREDTLWSVAKRYAKPLRRLAAENKLTEEQLRAADTPASLSGVHKLMIL